MSLKKDLFGNNHAGSSAPQLSISIKKKNEGDYNQKDDGPGGESGSINASVTVKEPSTFMRQNET